MSEKADITIHLDQAGAYVAQPNPFVLRKGTPNLRIANRSGRHLRVNLSKVPVEADELDIASEAIVTVPVKMDAPSGSYDYRAEEPTRRQSVPESSPKIIVESSPKIIIESAPVADV